MIKRIIAWVVTLILVIPLLVLKPDIGLLFLVCASALFVWNFKRSMSVSIVVAVIIAGGWTYLARDFYPVSRFFTVELFDVPLAVFSFWFLTLVFVYLALSGKNKGNWFLTALKMTAVHIILVLVFEFIFNNVITTIIVTDSVYPGWKFLNILHYPVWVQLGGFGSALLYYLIVCLIEFAIQGSGEKSPANKKPAVSGVCAAETDATDSGNDD